ncbi:MAG TPA: DNA-processing protein DprA, partial [Novosphingobium sp.]|nr:DNA-processing protein DprA [Novosphingobium sp.]
MAAVPPGRAAPLSHAEGLARIRLLRSARIGPVTFHQLLRQFGTAEAALAALPELAARGGLGRAGAQNYRPAAQGAIEAEIAATRRAGGRYLFHDSPDYPPLLRLADGAPPVLVARGDVRRAQGAAVALVGARDASGAARFLAREWGQKLAEMGFPVVSGLARGVDAAAHEGALAAATG